MKDADPVEWIFQQPTIAEALKYAADFFEHNPKAPTGSFTLHGQASESDDYGSYEIVVRRS